MRKRLEMPGEASEVSVSESAEPASQPAKAVVPSDRAERIKASAMPEAQKQECLKEIGALEVEKEGEKIPFEVYTRIRAVPKHLHKAMLAFPKAKGLRSASLKAWDEIFKGF